MPAKPSTRELLIEAGVEALRSLTAADLVSAIGTRSIARRAGVSPASFFHHFPNVTDYAAALLARVYDPVLLQADRLAANAEPIIGPLPADAARVYHSNELLRLSNDPEFRVRMGLWALGGQQADEAYRSFLQRTDAEFITAATGIWQAWGRELRPPLDVRTFVALQVSLLNGCTVRTLVDPDQLSSEDFGRTATALNILLLRVIGDNHTVDDRLTEMNYYPLREIDTGEPLTQRRTLTWARVLSASAELFGAYSYDNTSMSQIARQANVSQSTLFSLFENKSRLAVALWNKQLGDLLAVPDQIDAKRTRAQAAAEDGQDSQDSQVLVRHLRRLAEFAMTHTELATQYLGHLVRHAPTDVRDGVDAALVTTTEHVREAAAAGALRTDVDPETAARLLVTALVSQVIGAPSADAGATVDAVWRLVVGGLQAPA